MVPVRQVVLQVEAVLLCGVWKERGSWTRLSALPSPSDRSTSTSTSRTERTANTEDQMRSSPSARCTGPVGEPHRQAAVLNVYVTENIGRVLGDDWFVVAGAIDQRPYQLERKSLGSNSCPSHGMYYLSFWIAFEPTTHRFPGITAILCPVSETYLEHGKVHISPIVTHIR